MDVLQVTTHERTRVRVGLPRVVRTRVALTARGDVAVESDTLRVRRLPDVGGRSRVALVVPASTTGHDGRLEVEIAAGRALEIVEVTGTGAHDVQHARTQWLADLRLGRDAVLVWPTLPIVVADGADVMRLVHVDLAPGARVVLRETLVLGRPGTASGRVRSTIRARLDDAPLLSETFVAEPAPPLLARSHPALAPVPDRAPGPARDPAPNPVPSAVSHPAGAPAAGLGAVAETQRMDTLLVLGARLDHPGALQLEREGTMLRGPAARTHDGDLGGLVGPRVPLDAPAPVRPGP